MLAKSSSTPILGSLLPSSCSSPTVHFADSPTTSHHAISGFHPISCHLSGGSDHERPRGGMRRTCSEGNLSALSAHADDHDHDHHLPPSGKCARRTNPTLETIQSFTARDASPEEDEEDDDQEMEQELGFGSFGATTFSQEPPLFLARGLGIDRLGSGLLSVDGGGSIDCGSGSGGGGRGSYLVSSGNGGDRSDIEMRYNRMVEEDPSNGLFLRNYAQFLYQIKGDHRRAEEYYSRAILAEPNDGKLLSEYAKLIWDVHGDEERASSYFERAAQASPQNSHVLAAHAAFLWDTDDGDRPEEGSSEALGYTGVPVHASLASATT